MQKINAKILEDNFNGKTKLGTIKVKTKNYKYKIEACKGLEPLQAFFACSLNNTLRRCFFLAVFSDLTYSIYACHRKKTPSSSP